MGSSGSGRFGSYDINRDSSVKPKLSSTASVGKVGAGIGSQNVAQKIITLEDVATSEYYQNLNIVPQVGAEVFLRGGLHNKRMVVCDKATEMVLGNLPARFQADYPQVLDGASFSGVVHSSSVKPIPDVKVIIHG